MRSYNLNRYVPDGFSAPRSSTTLCAFTTPVEQRSPTELGHPFPGRVEDVVPVSGGDPARVAQLMQHLQALRIERRRPQKSGDRCVDGEAVGPGFIEGVHERPAVCRVHASASHPHAVTGPLVQRRIQQASAVPGQGSEFLPPGVEVAEHGVHRAETIQQALGDPRSHVESHVQALVEGGEHPGPQRDPPARDAAALIDQPA